MGRNYQEDEKKTPSRSVLRRTARRLARSDDGAAAIEFAILAFPYFLIVFAIIETFIAFTGEQLVTNAVDTMARKLRTGQITFGMGRTTDMNEKQFRTEFCNEISILITCSSTELTTPNKLYLDIRTFGTFAAIPKTIPRMSSDRFADIDTTSFKFNPGGPGTINMFRAYYRWQIMTDIVRPYITSVRPKSGMPTDFLIIATSAFQNEAYP